MSSNDYVYLVKIFQAYLAFKIILILYLKSIKSHERIHDSLQFPDPK